MTLKPVVAFAGKETLRNTSCVEKGADNVKNAHQNQVDEANAQGVNSRPFDRKEPMSRRNHAGTSEYEENTGANGSEIGLRKLVAQRDDDGEKTKTTDHRQINLPFSRIAIKHVVDAGNEGSRNQQ